MGADFNDALQITSVRAILGLPPVVAKQRECLRCGARFHSEGAHNRVCGPCKDKRGKMPAIVCSEKQEGE